MKRFISMAVLISLLSYLSWIPCSADRVCHWYTKRAEKGAPPIFSEDQVEVDRFGALYIDKRADASRDKIVYLTFDVGYMNESVQSILDTLKKEEVPAAFFVLRHFVSQSADTVRRMRADGHLICNHTASHIDMTTCSEEQLIEELREMEDLVLKTTGKPMDRYFRPPAGVYRTEILQTAQESMYTTVFWSLCYADWDNRNQPDPQAALHLLENYVHPGAIILLHPTSATNAKILQNLIARLKERGYRFGSLEEIKSI